MSKKLSSPTSPLDAALSGTMPREALRAMLSIYAPDEPLGPPEGIILTPQGMPTSRKRWTKRVLDTREKYPGYQPGHWYQEDMKYGRRPAHDAPLSQFITALINHAKAKWSGCIDGKRTKLQFVDWLPSYLDDKGMRWDRSRDEAATQFLRERYGMPPLAPKGRTGP